jgi:hypothetical protein
MGGQLAEMWHQAVGSRDICTKAPKSVILHDLSLIEGADLRFLGDIGHHFTGGFTSFLFSQRRFSRYRHRSRCVCRFRSECPNDLATRADNVADFIRVDAQMIITGA